MVSKTAPLGNAMIGCIIDTNSHRESFCKIQIELIGVGTIKKTPNMYPDMKYSVCYKPVVS